MFKNFTARVIITTNCNLNCDYCCNRLSEVQERFKMSTINQILKSNYNIYNITGGEPFLNMALLKHMCKELWRRNKTVYIYSNGLLITQNYLYEIKNYIAGITIGIHKFDAQSMDKYKSIQSMCKIFNNMSCRFLVDENNLWLVHPSISVETYKLNECTNEKEDWIIV